MRASRRLAALLLVFLLAAGATAGDTLRSPPPAMAAIPGLPSITGGIGGLPVNPCHFLPDGAGQTVCDGMTNPVGTVVGHIPGVGTAADFVGNTVSSAAEEAFNQALVVLIRGITIAETATFNFILEQEYKLFNDSTVPDISQQAFRPAFQLVAGIGFLLAMAGVAIKLVIAVKKQDANEIGDGFIRFATFVVGLYIVPTFFATAVWVCDKEITPAIMTLSNGRIEKTIENAGRNANGTVELVASLGQVLFFGILLFFAILGGVFFFILFAMRVMGFPLLMMAFIISLGMRTAGDEADGGRTRRLLTALAGLTVYKVVVAGILVMSSLILVNGIATLSWWPILIGATMEISIPLFSIAAWRWLTTHDFQATKVHYHVRNVTSTVYRRYAGAPAAAAAAA